MLIIKKIIQFNATTSNQVSFLIILAVFFTSFVSGCLELPNVTIPYRQENHGSFDAEWAPHDDVIGWWNQWCPLGIAFLGFLSIPGLLGLLGFPARLSEGATAAEVVVQLPPLTVEELQPELQPTVPLAPCSRPECTGLASCPLCRFFAGFYGQQRKARRKLYEPCAAFAWRVKFVLPTR